MRKSSVGSAVLGLLAVTVASIGATGVLMLLPFPNDRALFGCAGAITVDGSAAGRAPRWQGL